MSHPKLHPSIVIYSVWDKDDADVIVNGTIEYSGTEYREQAARISSELWQLELAAPEPKARRTPRNQDILWNS